MISKKIIHSDDFLDLPSTTQNLYFHLLLEADDEGFVNSPKRIQRTVGASDGDAQILVDRKFIILFESGIIVIKHWRIHNYIQSDRFKSTSYIEEKSKLSLKDNNVYKMDTNCTPSIGKISIDEYSIGENKQFSFSLTKETSYQNLSTIYKENLYNEIIKLGEKIPYDNFILSLEAKGYKYKNFLSAYKHWCKKDYNTTKHKRLEDMTLEEKMEYNEAERQRKIEANYG